MIEMLIRRPQPEEHDSVRAVVQTVVDEVYGGLWAPPPLPVDDEDWNSSWVAVREAKIIGVVRTSGEWLDDLWVLRESRGLGEASVCSRKGRLRSPLAAMKYCISASFNRMQQRSNFIAVTVGRSLGHSPMRNFQ